MGEHDIQTGGGEEAHCAFTRVLVEDLVALERMLAGEWFDEGPPKIGAEQELCLVDGEHRPARSSLDVLAALGDPRFTTELGRFNLEANLTPVPLSGDGFACLLRELRDLVRSARRAADGLGAHVVMCGILPTLEERHLGLDWMTPVPRYHHLTSKMASMRGGIFRTHVQGIDELLVTCDNVMLEACNTSFQVHLQVRLEEFARVYNAVQAATGPLLAVAGNSPVFLGNRLWRETRIALMQQTLDLRSEACIRRHAPHRVRFGHSWVRESVLELFREDAARQRVLMALPEAEGSLSLLARGQAPPLRALCLHNGTVYRWNRPCYGLAGGVPHLRIESRVLPAGPSEIDEVANAAFLIGLSLGLVDEFGDIARRLEFDHARANFRAAARYGLDAGLTWLDGEAIGAAPLIQDRLIGTAQRALLSRGVDAELAEELLGIVHRRVAVGRTGARWVLESLAAMGRAGPREARSRALVSAMVGNQVQGRPIHLWPLAPPPNTEVRAVSHGTIGQIMTTDLYTVHEDDSVDLAASIMDWNHVAHLPVEDEDGRLVGLVTHQDLLQVLSRGRGGPVFVRDVTCREPLTASPDTPTVRAFEAMQSHGVDCVLVVENQRLVGILTETDLVRISTQLLDRWLEAGPP